jgi:hypothetical protein
MSNIITLGTTEFQKAKATAVKNELIRKEINLSEFVVIDNETISIDGKRITLSEHAFKKILGRLRIPKAFANRFSSDFGKDGLRQLVEMMKTAKSSKNDQSVTLLVDPAKREIMDVLPAGYASISNESFVDFAERYISGYGLGVTHFGSDPRGGVIINCTSPNHIFQIPGLNTEVFNAGVSFSNTPSRGLEVSPYLTRLICTNGMTSNMFSENYGLHSFNEKNINEFNEHMVRMASTGFQPQGLREQITRATQTDASLAELQRAASVIMSQDKTIDYDYIQRFVPVDRAMKAYSTVGADPNTFSSKQMQNASAGLSVYDMVNGITNFASNDTRYGLDDKQRGNLMVSAGNLLMKRQYDTEGLLNVNPFANRSLLSESETAFVRGDK